jgi:hypothetical protein
MEQARPPHKGSESTIPDRRISSADDRSYKLLGDYIDPGSLTLMSHPLIPCCILDTVEVGRLGKSHASSRLCEHWGISGAADRGDYAHTERPKFIVHRFRDAGESGFRACEDTYTWLESV